MKSRKRFDIGTQSCEFIFLESTVEYRKVGRPLCDILRELWWSYVGLVNDTLGTLTEVIECYHMHHIILYHLALSSVIHLLG